MKITVPLTSSTIFFMVKFPFFLQGELFVHLHEGQASQERSQDSDDRLGRDPREGPRTIGPERDTRQGRLRSRQRTEDDGENPTKISETPTGKDEEHPLRESFSWIL